MLCSLSCRLPWRCAILGGASAGIVRYVGDFKAPRSSLYKMVDLSVYKHISITGHFGVTINEFCVYLTGSCTSLPSRSQVAYGATGIVL